MYCFGQPGFMPGYGASNCGGSGRGYAYALILVLFILLVIIGAARF